MSLGMTPQSLGEGLQVTNFDQCLHIIMVIGKCAVVFRGFFLVLGVGLRGGGYVGGAFLGEICHGEKKFNEKGAGFSKITIKKNNEKISMEKFFSIESKE